MSQDSFYAEFELHVGSRFIKVMDLVSDSSLFDSSRDILLGEDVLRRRIGTIIPCDREIIWWAWEDEPYEVLDLLLIQQLLFLSCVIPMMLSVQSLTCAKVYRLCSSGRYIP